MPEIIIGQTAPVPKVRESLDLVGNMISPQIDGDEHLYRSMTQSSRTDLSPVTQERMQEIALFLYRVNPLASRILKLSCGFIASGSVTFQAEDKKVQKALEDHWNHPLNDWENELFQRVFELSMYGELLLSTGVTGKGDVYLGYVSPLSIDKVEPTPWNAAKAGTVILKKVPGELEGRRIKVINYDPESERREGEAFFFTVNRVTDSMRGTSDLLPLADYIDNLDQLLFSLLERVAHMNSYLWDVKLTGASDEKVRAFLSELQANPPKPGGVRAHNDLVEWQAVTPDLHAQDDSDHVRMFRNHILGGAGLAEWMFADSGGTGRATASEMAEPTYKSLSTRQREIKGFLAQVFDYVIDTKIASGQLDPDVKRKFSISLPKISLRDFQRTSGALYRTAQAIELMLANGLIDREKGVKLASSLIDQLDLESDVPVGPLPPMPTIQTKPTPAAPAAQLSKSAGSPKPKGSVNVSRSNKK